MGVGGQRHAPAAFSPRERPGTHCTGPVWIDAENLAPTEIRSPDLPARSESLYRLRSPGPYMLRKALHFPLYRSPGQSAAFELFHRKFGVGNSCWEKHQRFPRAEVYLQPLSSSTV